MNSGCLRVKAFHIVRGAIGGHQACRLLPFAATVEPVTVKPY